MRVNANMKKNRTKQCPSWEGCSAPLCPIDKSFGLALWFPDEAVCNAFAYRGTSLRLRSGQAWRKAQAKIAKRCIDRDTCYTVKMLSAVRLVGRGIKGITDSEDLEPEKAWLRQHGQRPSAGSGQWPSVDEKWREPDRGKDLVGVVDSQRHPDNVTVDFKGELHCITPYPLKREEKTKKVD